MSKQATMGRRAIVIATALAILGALVVASPRAAAEPVTALVPSGGGGIALDEISADVLGALGPAVAAPPATFPYEQTFQLHSRPGASKVIHLDFDGYTSPADVPLGFYGVVLADVTYLPYDLDGDPNTFSDAERDVVQEVWRRVAETFAPWDVDVTTEEPTDDALFRDPNDPFGDTTWGVRSLITNSTSGGVIDFCPVAGGCAGLGQVGSFGSLGIDLTTPASVTLPMNFVTGQYGAGRAGDAQLLAGIVTHELGHNLGLAHDEVATPTGVWSALMEAGHAATTPLAQFTPNTGDFTAADFSLYGLFPRPDGHGDNAMTATPLVGPNLAADGIVHFGGDEDWFSFAVDAGDTINLAIVPSSYSSMLDVEATLFDAADQQVAFSNPPAVAITSDQASGVDATFTDLVLQAGTYFLRVRGSGGDGYTSYGTIGSYSLTGAVSSPTAPCPPGSFSATGGEPCTLAPAGSFVDLEGATEVVLCPPGFYSDAAGSTSCTPAPLGSYVGASGATNPTPCPPGTTTMFEGATACSAEDTTPPIIVAEVSGGEFGSNGWHTAGPITVTWQVSDPESALTSPPCSGGVVSSDTPATQFSCAATSAGGSVTQSVTVQLDSVLPTVVYSGNAASYGILDTVAISCTAADALSGLASDTCIDASSPAWSIGAGSHTLTATATDNAGNSATATTTYMVTATPGDLCTLTLQFVEASSQYGSLSRWGRFLLSRMVGSACSLLDSITPRLSPARLARQVASYDRIVARLAQAGWLTPAEATTLHSLAATL